MCAPFPPPARYTALPNGVLQISGVQEEDVGSYRCMASNAANRRLSRNATLTVTPGRAPPLHASSAFQTIKLGQQVALLMRSQASGQEFPLGEPCYEHAARQQMLTFHPHCVSERAAV